MAGIAVNLQPTRELETCVRREKLGDIYQTSPEQWLFVCSRCTEEFPLYVQFVAHAQKHLADCYTNSLKSVAASDRAERIEAKSEIEFVAAQSEEEAEVSDPEDSRFNDGGQTDDDATRDDAYAPDDEGSRTGKLSFECYICHLPFTARRHCHNHLREHSGYHYQCDYCMEKFVRKGIAKCHRSKCGPANQFQCTRCALKFYNKQARKLHNRKCPGKIHRPHDEPDMFACHRCAVTFIDQWHYARHMQTHETPIYRCGNCAYDTYVAANIAEHTALCTKTCPLCQKRLTTRQTFRTHMLQHQNVKNFQCATCGKQFVSKSALDKHAVTHTGERKYMCDVCPMAFKRSDKLARHRRLHADDYLRTCKFCAKFFRVKRALERHALKVHGKAWDADVD